MKKSLISMALVLFVLVFAVSCGEKVENKPEIAASVLTRAMYLGAIDASASQFVPKNQEAARAIGSTLDFSKGKIVACDGKNYTVKGIITYTYSAVTENGKTVFTSTINAKDISISGKDYNKVINAVFTVTGSLDLSNNNVSIEASGTVDGTIINKLALKVSW